jgi:hypothetical protein
MELRAHDFAVKANHTVERDAPYQMTWKEHQAWKGNEMEDDAEQEEEEDEEEEEEGGVEGEMPDVVKLVLDDAVNSTAEASEAVSAVLGGVVVGVLGDAPPPTLPSSTPPAPPAPPAPPPTRNPLDHLIMYTAHPNRLLKNNTLDVQARFEAVEKLLLHHTARLPSLSPSTDDASKNLVASSLSGATASVSGILECGVPSYQHCGGNADDLLAGVKVLEQAVEGVSPPRCNVDGKRAHHDPNASCYSSLRKLAAVKVASKLLLDKPASPVEFLSLVKLARKQTNLRTAGNMLTTISSVFPELVSLSPAFKYVRAQMSFCGRSGQNPVSHGLARRRWGAAAAAAAALLRQKRAVPRAVGGRPPVCKLFARGRQSSLAHGVNPFVPGPQTRARSHMPPPSH